MDSIELNFERTFVFRKGVTCFEGGLRIERVFLNQDGKWTCLWSMDYICADGAKVYGSDPLNALTNCLAMVKELICLTIADGINIWWQYEGDEGAILTFLSDKK